MPAKGFFYACTYLLKLSVLPCVCCNGCTNYLHSLSKGAVHSFIFNIMLKNVESPATTEKGQTTPLTATQKKLLKDVRLQCLKSDHFYNEVLKMLQPETDSVSNSNNSQQ